MADLEPVIAEADWSALAGEVTRLGRQRALVVLLTPLEPASVYEGLLPVLPTLVRHHRVVLASVRTRPSAGSWTPGRSLDEVYAAAAASQVLAERRARGPACWAPSGSTCSTPTPSGCRRRSPTTTSP